MVCVQLCISYGIRLGCHVVVVFPENLSQHGYICLIFYYALHEYITCTCVPMYMYIHGYAGELFAAMRLRCRWVSEWKPEEVRGVKYHFFLPHLIAMLLHHTSCRRAGVCPKGFPQKFRVKRYILLF